MHYNVIEEHNKFLNVFVNNHTFSEEYVLTELAIL